MKQKDIILIMVVAFISVVVSIVVSKFVFATPANRQQNVEVVQPISASFPPADKRYFNPQSIDPTQLITIGSNANPVPFNSTTPN